jgi:hypothetical protein
VNVPVQLLRGDAVVILEQGLDFRKTGWHNQPLAAAMFVTK